MSVTSSAMHLEIQNKQFDLLPFPPPWLQILDYFISESLFFFLMAYYVGLSTSDFAWAFHSVAEEELLSMLPALQKGDPTWSELRAMGIGWWVRNIHSLRKCIEKVNIAFWNKITKLFSNSCPLVFTFYLCGFKFLDMFTVSECFVLYFFVHMIYCMNMNFCI